jgi:uncharacterized membrane protein
MKYRSVDILVVVALTIAAVALTFIVPPDNVPGRILALPLVLLLPGYALTSALFAGRAPGFAERLVFSLGLSLVIVVLGGLALNWTPFGLQADSWSVLLSGITLGACAITLVRRREQSISASRWSAVGNTGLTFRQGLLLSQAVVVVLGAMIVSYIGAAQQPLPGFSQLWMLPVSGAKSGNAVRLGVSNMELTTMQYSLDVSMGDKLIKDWPSISLKPNEKWQATLVLPQILPAGTTRVEAALYRKDAPTKIYRHVVLWLGT